MTPQPPPSYWNQFVFSVHSCVVCLSIMSILCFRLFRCLQTNWFPVFIPFGVKMCKKSDQLCLAGFPVTEPISVFACVIWTVTSRATSVKFTVPRALAIKCTFLCTWAHRLFFNTKLWPCDLVFAFILKDSFSVVQVYWRYFILNIAVFFPIFSILWTWCVFAVCFCFLYKILCWTLRPATPFLSPPAPPLLLLCICFNHIK